MKPKKKKPVSPAIREVRKLERKLRASESELDGTREDLSCARAHNDRLRHRVDELETEAARENRWAIAAVALIAVWVATVVYYIFR